jgi:chlorobactene glucosyltransferase
VAAVVNGLLAFEFGLAAAWWAFTILVGVIWLLRHREVNRGSNEYVLRRDEAPLPDENLPRLSVLVAAKDEEPNIVRCIEGLLAQDYPDFEVIAINDRSNDRTGEILDDLAARDARLRVVHIQSLPEGWFGKNHAMHNGVQRAGGQWLCFTDADCTYESPHLLRSAARFALRESADFVSVLPRLETHSLWERIVQPAAGAVMLYWFPPHAVNDPKARPAYANGAFMLMPRASYERLGGHEPVKATLNEDMHLARRCKQIGLRLRVIRGERLYHVRMYTGFRQIWNGWSRIFYGCLGTFPRLLGSVLMLSFFSLAPYVTLVLSPLSSHSLWPASAGAFAVIGQQSVLIRYYHISGSGWRWALTYPLGALLVLGMTLNAIRRLGRGTVTVWRGTTYRGGAQA